MVQPKNDPPPVPPLDINKILEQSRGEQTNALFSNAPEVIKELTAQLIQHKDIRVRERVRAQMKGLFALVLADTEYPAETEPLDESKKDRFDEVV
jgi:hypothetical protein